MNTVLIPLCLFYLEVHAAPINTYSSIPAPKKSVVKEQKEDRLVIVCYSPELEFTVRLSPLFCHCVIICSGTL